MKLLLHRSKLRLHLCQTRSFGIVGICGSLEERALPLRHLLILRRQRAIYFRVLGSLVGPLHLRIAGVASAPIPVRSYSYQVDINDERTLFAMWPVVVRVELGLGLRL